MFEKGFYIKLAEIHLAALFNRPVTMDNKLRQLLEDASPRFNEWIQIINLHNEAQQSLQEYTQDELADLTYKVAAILGEISELFFKYGAFKDKFDNSKMYLNVYGLSVIIKSEKTGTTYHLGLDERGIYLDTFLRDAENLRHMDDSFYQDILHLNDLGKFELLENEFYGKETTKQYPELFNNQKSTIFKLLRNYVVGMGREEQNIVLGQFQILWTYEDGFYETISNGCLAFKALYKLNYALWKISDLKSKKIK